MLTPFGPSLPPRLPVQVRNNAGGLWNHGAFFLHNLAPFGSQVGARWLGCKPIGSLPGSACRHTVPAHLPS